MKKEKNSRYIILALLVSCFFNINLVFAEEISGGNVCAQVVPCDENGNVLAKYKSGECANYYAQSCYLYSLSQKEALCQAEITKYKKELNKKIRRINKLKSQLKSCKNKRK